MSAVTQHADNSSGPSISEYGYLLEQSLCLHCIDCHCNLKRLEVDCLCRGVPVVFDTL